MDKEECVIDVKISLNKEAWENASQEIQDKFLKSIEYYILECSKKLQISLMKENISNKKM